MSDLISRRDAIDALEEQLDYLQMLNKDENPTAESKWYGVNWARNTIADLPSAQQNQRWIPCSERLPDKKGKYLCTVHYAVPPYHMFHPELDMYVDEISIQEFKGAENGNVAFIDSVVAWMPLPEPYKAERREE